MILTTMKRKYWIMKCEPEILSIDNLKIMGEYFWDGVRNYQVRNMFRDEMKVGDKALFYQSNTKIIGIVGEMVISKVAEVDKTQFDSNSRYYDVKATKDNPRWLGPTVSFKRKFKNIVTLKQINDDTYFSDLPLVKKGNRLSVISITKEQYTRLVKLGNKNL